ncbi:MAG: type 4a pilus biogenesis protein PilO [Patescibacteria group bacterium]
MFYQKNKFLINLGMIMIIVIAMIIFIIIPAFKEIIAVNREINKERVALEQKLEQGLNLKKIQIELSEIQDKLGGLDRLFVAKGQELAFVTEMENIASADGISLKIVSDFSEEPLKGEEKIKKTALQMEISGNYQNIIKFLNDLEKMPYYFNVEMAIFSLKTNALSAQILGQIYVKN